MKSNLTVAHISTFSPTQCGIATYAEDLIESLRAARSVKISVDYQEGIDRAPEQKIIISHEEDYAKAAAFINDSSEIDIVSLQHEFAIFGGTAGSYVLTLARELKKPLVSTLHTVRSNMGPQKAKVLNDLAALSGRVIVLDQASADRLIRDCAVPAAKVVVIPHGIPEVDFVAPEATQLRQALNSPPVFVSAGYLRNTKGYHIALEALAEFRRLQSDFKYLILGTDQPQFGGDAWYRAELEKIITRFDLAANIVRVDSYLSRSALLEHILAADVGLVTYTEEEQNASGILPLLLGCGRVVVATAFAYARAMDRQFEGLFLAKMNNPENLFQVILKVAHDQKAVRRLMANNYDGTRDWVWRSSAAQYRRIFAEMLAANAHAAQS